MLEVLVVLEEALAAVLADEKYERRRVGSNGWQYWEETCRKCLDEPGRSAHGRTIERETRTYRSGVVAYRGRGDSEPENVSEGDHRRLECWYPDHSLRRERLHQIHFIYTVHLRLA
ncbi:conserved hypothetical protein [Trichinella spiralis]|uniref:hypothetical protein n=1 Tax=Trichinella spiralis TaxID=6334 RepID=UPI0001EFDF54|nr:conserved hypothetical protein [Trichinella spiralis]